MTRWGSIGPSSRRYFRSLACGVDGLMEVAKSDEDIGMFHLNGYFTASLQHKRFLLVASFAAVPSEAFTMAMLEDDRLLMRSEEVWAMMQAKLTYVEALPDFVWARCAGLIGSGVEDVPSLRQAALRAIHISMGYLYAKAMFKPIWKRLPRVLTQSLSQPLLKSGSVWTLGFRLDSLWPLYSCCEPRPSQRTWLSKVMPVVLGC